MERAELERIAGQKPFRPFELRMDDGSRRRFLQRHGFLIFPHAFHFVDEQRETFYINYDSILQVVYLDEIVEVY